MNIIIHSIGGDISVVVSPERVVIEAVDRGPGIENIDLAMQEGWSTAGPLARELGLCYASLALVVNWGAGIEGDHLEMAQMREMQHQMRDRVLRLARAVLLNQDAWDSCRCGASLLTP